MTEKLQRQLQRLGTRAASQRAKQKISLEKLGAMVGLDKSSLSRLEHGQLNATLETFFAIADALEIKPHKLLL